MRCFISISVILLLGADTADDAQKDGKLFQGTWSVVSAERDGRSPTAEELKTSKVVIMGDEMALTIARPKEEKATFKLDAGKQPKAIDILPLNMKPAPGIYELKGDTLKICWRRNGQDRPTGFKADAGSGYFLLVLKREK